MWPLTEHKISLSEVEMFESAELKCKEVASGPSCHSSVALYEIILYKRNS